MGFIVAREHRMIRRQEAKVKLMEPPLRIGGGLAYHPFEAFLSQSLAAGTAYQNPSGF
jgi:hypothetical protein